MTFRSIQSFRTLAAVMVVLHYVLSHGADAQQEGVAWLQAGVDIFFVISGFVMVASTEGKSLSATQFLLARLMRIVPLYWFALAIYLVLLFAARDNPPPIGDIVKSCLFVFYTDTRTGEPAPYLTPGWSLNYEMYFYLLFALLIHVPVAKRIAILAAYFAAAVVLRRFFDQSDALAFRLTSPLLLEFVGGMVLGHWRDLVRRGGPLPGMAFALAGAAILILAPHADPRILFYGVPAVMMVAGAIMAEPLFRHPLMNPAVALGDASYSLYLSHSIIIRSMIFLGAEPLMRTGLGKLAVALICIAACLPVYRLIEKPLTAAARSLLSRSERQAKVAPGMPPS